ncbi:MAG: methionyl-tRNA formyltransferase [Phycisphaerae bacterium]
MRLVFCGSGTFAVPTLKALMAAEHELAMIVTQPPRKAGRGGKLRPTPISAAAEQAGRGEIVYECPSINKPEALEKLQAAEYDVMVVVDFGQLIKQPARQTAKRSAFNLHGSILPELRGAAPVNWALIRGYERTGVTTFELVDKMDAGPVYESDELTIGPEETAAELRERLSKLGVDTVLRTLGELDAGWASAVEQDHEKATLAPRLKKADGRIDWSADAEEIHNLIRGTWPWPGGQTLFVRENGKELPLVIARASVADGHARSEPGTVDGDLCVSTGEGRLQIEQLKPAGKRLMDWKDFTNGYRVQCGNRFLAVTDE